MKLLLAVAGILLVVCTPYCLADLEIELNGVMTNLTQFCAGDKLLFTCTIPGSLFEWIAPPFLDGSVGNGRVALRDTELVGNITLTANGTGNSRSSTLRVTAFPGLNGVNILCRESGGDPNVNQDVTITVLGLPLITVDTMVMNSLNDSTLTMSIPSSVTLDRCLQSINASLSAKNDSAISTEERLFMVDNSVFTATFDGLNLCDYSYNYTAMGFGIIDTEPDTGDIAVEGTGNVRVVNITSGGNSVTIILDVIFDDCPSSIVQVNRSDGGIKMINVGRNQMLEFTDSEPTIETCTVYANLNSGSMFRIGSFECDINKSPISSTISMSTASSPPPPPDDPTSSNVLPPGAIAGIAVAGIVAAIVVLLVLIVGLFICCKSKNRKESKSNKNVEMEQKLEYKPEENMPTYQAPDSIKREVASNTGDVYTVPETKKKKKAKSRPEEDAPTYSVVDKGKKKDENLVYADIDVKNPTAGRSKRPPPPPGVTEHDANEPVVYSTLQ